MKTRWLVTLCGAVLLSAGVWAAAETRVKVEGLYPARDGEAMQLVVPDSWTLVETVSSPNT